MDLECFSHGQIQSKLWLCQKIEPFLPKTPSVLIVGSWYNVLGFMLLTREPNRYAFITGVDIDPKVKPIADKLCEAWQMCNTVLIRNDTNDACNLDYMGYNVVINCSVEHMKDNLWFDKIQKNTLVCLQSCNLSPKSNDWKIVNPNYSLQELEKKYPLSHTLFSEEKSIQYENWGYKRFMIIGYK